MAKKIIVSHNKEDTLGNCPSCLGLGKRSWYCASCKSRIGVVKFGNASAHHLNPLFVTRCLWLASSSGSVPLCQIEPGVATGIRFPHCDLEEQHLVGRFERGGQEWLVFQAIMEGGRWEDINSGELVATLDLMVERCQLGGL